MKTINYSDFKTEVIDYKNLALVTIRKTDCEPCDRLETILTNMENLYTKESCKFIDIDLEKNSSLTAYYRIKGLPTVLLFKNGNLKDTLMGIKTPDEYEALLTKYLHPEETFKNHSVTVFSTPTCPYCFMVKQYLKDNGVPYTEIDVASNQQKAEEMVNRSGQMGVPQLWIDNEVVVGFDKPKINNLLGI